MPIYWGLGVDDLSDDFADRTSRNMPEPTNSTPKKHRRQSSRKESMAKDGGALVLVLRSK